MENLDKLEKLVQQIKSISGYKFKKPIYLLNAFKPRTTQNNFFGNNYEVLEFIGDKAIGIAVVRLLVSYFKLDIDNTKLDDFQSNHPNCFKQSSNEGILTQIEDNLTQEEYLSQCFIKLNLDWNWILDVNQINQKDDQKTSVQSNILEAIVGAIALDSEFDNNLLLSVVTKFLDFDQFMDNYHEVKPNFIGKLQEWSSKFNVDNEYKLPKYDPENGKNIGNSQNVECKVTIMIENQLKTFSASSTSYSSAKYEVAKIACQYLRKKGYINW